MSPLYIVDAIHMRQADGVAGIDQYLALNDLFIRDAQGFILVFASVTHDLDLEPLHSLPLEKGRERASSS